MNQFALEITNLKKTYDSGAVALKGINLSVEEGDFFALLGPNGAGKSSTIGIIGSLVTKTDGKVKIFDIDIDKNFPEAKRMLGVVSQEINFNNFEKVMDIVTTQAGFYGIPLALAKEKTETVLKRLGLWDKRDEQARNLSGGFKRRLMIAKALIHEPKLLILDEPTAALGVAQTEQVLNLVRRLADNGLAVVLISHNLNDVFEVADNIAALYLGNMAAQVDKNEVIPRQVIELITTGKSAGVQAPVANKGAK